MRQSTVCFGLSRTRLLTDRAQSLADWFDFDVDAGYDPGVIVAVPHRLASRCFDQFRGAVKCIQRTKEGRPQFLKDEYEKVYAQYQAIENPDARQAFFVERHQLVKRIQEVWQCPVFSSKVVSAHACVY